MRKAWMTVTSWGCSSFAECLLNVLQALGLILSIPQNKHGARAWNHSVQKDLSSKSASATCQV